MAEKEYGNLYTHLKPCDGENEECFKCGAKERLFKDPYIEGLCFCETCWEERRTTEKLTEMGMEEEIPFDD